MKIKINKLQCQRCKHEWMPRVEDVRQCPKCKSAWWDKKIHEIVGVGVIEVLKSLENI